MITDQYAMAIIYLPIQLHPDGTNTPLTEIMTVNVTPCSELPTNVKPNSASAEFANQLNLLAKSSKHTSIVSDPATPMVLPENQENPNSLLKDEFVKLLTITRDELTRRTAKQSIQNTTFRNKRPVMNRHTMRNRTSS
jgi:hypothetical protein